MNNIDHSEPTHANQLWHARKLASEKGLEALRNPHALIGMDCGCGTCFCCAAYQVVTEIERQDARQRKARKQASHDHD